MEGVPHADKKGRGEKRLLTVEGAAEALSVHRTTVYDLINSGKLASVKIGRLRRVPVAALDAYIQQLTAETAVEVELKIIRPAAFN
ncbi:helix-turn-helix domain-containing protein [Deinococcus radiomollis]|uniref:helix-turn-helix domain-containing protein n=1 Tax=Deinococcus radiomollis TaxID=468916 RepID=UPI0038912A19